MRLGLVKSYFTRLIFQACAPRTRFVNPARITSGAVGERNAVGHVVTSMCVCQSSEGENSKRHLEQL